MLGEVALLGFIGGVIGSCGVVIGHMAIGGLPSTMVPSLDSRLEYVLPLWVVPLAIAASVVASLTASALAARQVHGVAPIEALAPSVRRRRRRFPLASDCCGHRGGRPAGRDDSVVTADLGRIAMASIALAFIGSRALFRLFGSLIRAAAGVARLFGAAGVLGAATIERAPQRMWVAMMTVLTAVVTTVAVTGATSNAVDSTVASFALIADADVWVSSAAAMDFSSDAVATGHRGQGAGVPGVDRVVPDQMAFATVGDTRVMLLGIVQGSHRDIYASMSARDREKLLAGDGVALSRDLGSRWASQWETTSC